MKAFFTFIDYRIGQNDIMFDVSYTFLKCNFMYRHVTCRATFGPFCLSMTVDGHTLGMCYESTKDTVVESTHTQIFIIFIIPRL